MKLVHALYRWLEEKIIAVLENTLKQCFSMFVLGCTSSHSPPTFEISLEVTDDDITASYFWVGWPDAMQLTLGSRWTRGLFRVRRSMLWSSAHLAEPPSTVCDCVPGFTARQQETNGFHEYHQTPPQLPLVVPVPLIEKTVLKQCYSEKKINLLLSLK